jgi:ATP-dependent HslUV protease subunit HslV
MRATTVLCVRRGPQVAMIGDGQVTMSESIVLKSTARKVRRMRSGRILCGFAGATADALTLYDLLDAKLQEHSGNLTRACVEVAKQWRTDRALQRLEAMLVVADAEHTFLLTGAGDVVEPEEGVVAIGSGGPYALAAARALVGHTDLGAAELARAAMEVAAQMCVFTNDRFTVETLDP